MKADTKTTGTQCAYCGREDESGKAWPSPCPSDDCPSHEPTTTNTTTMKITATYTDAAATIRITSDDPSATNEQIIAALAQLCYEEQILGNLDLYVNGITNCVVAGLASKYDFDYEEDKCERVRAYCADAINLGADMAQDLADERANTES